MGGRPKKSNWQVILSDSSSTDPGLRCYCHADRFTLVAAQLAGQRRSGMALWLSHLSFPLGMVPFQGLLGFLARYADQLGLV